MSKVLDYINANLQERLAVADLAKIAAVSPSYFCEAFRRWTGTSLSDYILYLRIERARFLLEDGDLPIGDIAVRLGFYDHGNFSRAFRRVTALTPRAYRNMLKGGDGGHSG